MCKYCQSTFHCLSSSHNHTVSLFIQSDGSLEQTWQRPAGVDRGRPGPSRCFQLDLQEDYEVSGTSVYIQYTEVHIYMANLHPPVAQRL